MDKVIEYIKTIKVTINLSLDTVLKFLINESHLKNGFELGIFSAKGTCARGMWEMNLFKGIYDETTEPVERVKYGTLNIFDEKNGIPACSGYGNVFFVLKDQVKNRISFVNGDSSQMMFHICTFKYCTALLVHLPDYYLKALILHVLENKKVETSQYFNYIEAQIHGLFRMNMDIEKLCIKNSLVKDTKTMNSIEQFCFWNDIKLELIE